MKSWNTHNGCQITRVLSGRSNAFLVTGGKMNILVDTGPRFMRKRLLRNLSMLDIRNIDYLVVTHAHFDHAGNAAYLRETFGAKVLIHRIEGRFLSLGMNPLTGGTNMFTHILAGLFMKQAVKRFKYEACAYDMLVDDRFDLEAFGFRAFVLHTPGHTSGSVSLIIDDEIALVGDTMFGVRKNAILPPYAFDEVELFESWEKLLGTGCMWFFPSHGSERDRELVEMEFERLTT